jgi:hypothetical protein
MTGHENSIKCSYRCHLDAASRRRPQWPHLGLLQLLDSIITVMARGYQASGLDVLNGTQGIANIFNNVVDVYSSVSRANTRPRQISPHDIENVEYRMHHSKVLNGDDVFSILLIREGHIPVSDYGIFQVWSLPSKEGAFPYFCRILGR